MWLSRDSVRLQLYKMDEVYKMSDDDSESTEHNYMHPTSTYNNVVQQFRPMVSRLSPPECLPLSCLPALVFLITIAIQIWNKMLLTRASKHSSQLSSSHCIPGLVMNNMYCIVQIQIGTYIPVSRIFTQIRFSSNCGQCHVSVGIASRERSWWVASVVQW